MKLRRRFALTVETESGGRADIREIRPLRVHVIVHAEDDDVARARQLRPARPRRDITAKTGPDRVFERCRLFSYPFQTPS